MNEQTYFKEVYDQVGRFTLKEMQTEHPEVPWKGLNNIMIGEKDAKIVKVLYKHSKEYDLYDGKFLLFQKKKKATVCSFGKTSKKRWIFHGEGLY